MSDAIESFFGAWSEADAAARLSAVKATLASAAIYIDPRTSEPLSGADAISEYIGMFASSAPGATANVVDAQTQHSMTRVTVAFRMPGGMEQMGQYFVEKNEAGAITRIVGFVGTGVPS